MEKHVFFTKKGKFLVEKNADGDEEKVSFG